MATKISELDKTVLTTRLEAVLESITKFLGLDLEYDFAIEGYKTLEDEEREFIRLQLKTDKESLMIGYHGQTLDRLQQLISLGLSQEFKQPVRVVLDINNYREKRITTLENLARRAQQQVEESGQELELQPMNAAERRIIHKLLQDEGKVATESRGEGQDRRIVVKPL